ncbi:MAG: riboflavin synthase [Oceanicaulis sp.]|uniref:riboflavin synthase n=1 Tax=Glycocaulis sp. TaxID=1969725 RepID=UPI0025B9837F|nr:riboflavin synthase [Glycocaulis sp.]MCC5980716.1 riboflavin synthase [Oceanicaulis sp.]MCH8521097.1 riboflavin synthase [Glycocaulis sp.]
MFTGIVTALGELVAIDDGPVRRFTIDAPWPAAELTLGASVAHDGVCLTLVDIAARPEGARYAVEVSPETLNRTTLGRWQVGTKINLERPLKAGDELGGHIVQGHVDGVGEIVTRTDTNGWMALSVRAPRDLARFIAEKGSIAVDGVSLTVNGVKGDVFELMIIPHTAAVTTLSRAAAGVRVNLEVDIMARYAARLIEYPATESTPS